MAAAVRPFVPFLVLIAQSAASPRAIVQVSSVKKDDRPGTGGQSLLEMSTRRTLRLSNLLGLGLHEGKSEVSDKREALVRF